MEVMQLGPLSLDFGSSTQHESNLGISVNQVNNHDGLDSTLAIPTTPSSFMPLELQPEDLMNDDEIQQAILSDTSSSLHNGSQAVTSDLSLQVSDSATLLNDNMLIDLNMTISNDLEATLILDHNLSPLIQMNAEAGVNSNTTLVAHAVTEQGEDQANLQVGMVLLPENLDFELGLAHHYNVPLSFLQSSISLDDYRLWAKHFAPCGFPDVGVIS
jgi:hypothetical protein